jgi:hypothetical protein
MSKHDIIKFDATVPAKFANWFGPPAVLTAEDQQIHDRILCGLFHDVSPQDFFECIFIHDLAYNFWRRLALRCCKDKVIRHANNEKFERQKHELVQDAERRKEEIRRLNMMFEPRYPAARDRQPQTKIAIEREIWEARMNKQLGEVDAETNQKLAEIQKAKDGPFDEAAIFDQWIDPVERIDDELAMVEQNIRITYKLLDEHRSGLGQRLRQFADEVVDVEFAEEPVPARQEAIGRAESGPMTASSVAELPSTASSQTNGAPVQLDGPGGSGPPPSSGPAE